MLYNKLYDYEEIDSIICIDKHGNDAIMYDH